MCARCVEVPLWSLVGCWWSIFAPVSRCGVFLPAVNSGCMSFPKWLEGTARKLIFACSQQEHACVQDCLAGLAVTIGVL
jgi:hypothetical protein